MAQDFLSLYLKYTDETECPVIYSRWAAIAGIGALLGRKSYIQLGHFKIYPNIYCMLIGTAGARKSTTINIQKRFLNSVGYSNIAADKSSKEKFLLDLAGEGDEFASTDTKSMEDFLWASPGGSNDSSEILIAADEFNNFLGNGNIEFLSLLGVLWDYDGAYKNRIKTGKSVTIQDPTVSILAGNTPTGFHLAFPPEALGQGFFSRTIFIYGEPRDRKYTFPKEPDAAFTELVRNELGRMYQQPRGKLEISDGARKLLDRIYQNRSSAVADIRFDSYNTRRFTHLLKLCIICNAGRNDGDPKLTEQDVIYANTILTHAELYMPKALGGFGKAKNSDVSHKVVQVIESSPTKCMELLEIWKHVANDLEGLKNLVDILSNLVHADKIQSVPGKGFLPKKTMVDMSKNTTVDFGLLTAEEKEMKL